MTSVFASADSVQETLGVSPPKMDETNVPDLIRVGAIQTNMSMDVSSDVLDPIVINQSNCRFRLTNKGYLHDGSRITLSVKGTAQTTAGAFLPLNLGVHSLIRRATLSIGGNTISETDDYNHFKAFESMFLSSEINKDREAYMSGRQISHEFNYNSIAGQQSNTSANTYGLGTGLEYGDATNANPSNLNNDTVLDINNQPVFSVTLGELFPFMKGVNLPLFAMKQDVTIDLVWEPISTEGRVSVNANATASELIEIDTTQVKLVADYIFYDGEIMSQQLAAYNSSPTNFAYNDYRLTKTTLSVDAAKNSVRNLGGAGRIITKVISFVNDDNRGARHFLNKYAAVAPAHDYVSAVKSNGELTTNIRMNDFFVFPIDLSNSAVIFDKTSRAMGALPFVTREEYSGEGNVLTAGLFEDVAQNSSLGLSSNFFFQAYKLPAGRINSRGLELTTKLVSLPVLGAGKNYTQRTYIEVSRVAVLSNGFLTSGFL